MTDCPQCGAGLETPLGCTACGVLFSPEKEPTPFEALGLEPSYAVDRKDLKKRLLRFSRMTHPDFFGTAEDETRALAEHNSAAVNAAHEILSDDFRRADHLVRLLGGPSEKDERQMPQEFLMEVLEWNEALEECRGAPAGSPEREALDALADALTENRATTLAEIADTLTPLPTSTGDGAKALKKVRRRLNAIRYLDRALREIRELRLEESTSS